MQLVPAAQWLRELWCALNRVSGPHLTLPELRWVQELAAPNDSMSWAGCRVPLGALVLLLRRIVWQPIGACEWWGDRGVPVQLTK